MCTRNSVKQLLYHIYRDAIGTPIKRQQQEILLKMPKSEQCKFPESPHNTKASQILHKHSFQ